MCVDEPVPTYGGLRGYMRFLAIPRHHVSADMQIVHFEIRGEEDFACCPASL